MTPKIKLEKKLLIYDKCVNLIQRTGDNVRTMSTNQL